MTSEQMPNFKALSLREKWQLVACVRRGRAPENPRTAAAAVEWITAYRQSGRGRQLRILLPIVMLISAGATVQFAIQGDALVAAVNGAFLVVCLLNVALTPVLRPGNCRRSLEASSKIAAASRS